MAEIKSTMEMVLARAAAICEDAEEPQDDTLLHDGMKAAAAFLKEDEPVSLKALIAARQPDPGAFCAGLLQVFLRHLVLPRDESQPWEVALRGLSELAAAWHPEAAGQLAGYVSEIRNILSRYFEHRKQVRNELEQAFAQQAALLEQSLAQQTGLRRKINPDQHPKFQDEWLRVTEQMNGQYLRAIDQYKEAITQLLSTAAS